MDIMVRTPIEVEDALRLGDPFIREILSTGKILYEQP
jgi:hypothetical protein